MVYTKVELTLKDYIENCRLYELSLATKQLEQGIDPTIIIQRMSVRLCNKMLHPSYKILLDSYDLPYNNSLRRLEYNEYLNLKNLKPKPDHIIDDK